MVDHRPKVLGLSASLRNARFGAGSALLVEELNALETRGDLEAYLKRQARIRVDDFVIAGRDQSLDFDVIYRNLQQQRDDQGLSNSEVVLAAGLWGAQQVGCEIEHLGLSHYFPAHTKGGVDLEELKARILEADAILLSTPVYFGDRSSVAHDLIEMIRNDEELCEKVKDKVFAGISVGAKRNGGQETTLIYMLLDMTSTGMLGVGNDSETTSQYGGTALGGDVGTVGDDKYGLDTSIGVGKRIGHVANLLKRAENQEFQSALRIHIWLLQDADKRALKELESVVETLHKVSKTKIDVTILELTNRDIHRCIACDICPTHVDKDEEYRCIIQKGIDPFKENHNVFLEPDAVIVAALSPNDRSRLLSTYQRFMERTRYLRRGDYVLSDIIVAPLVFQDLGSKENLHLRILTSMLRHHTVMTHPMIGYVKDDIILNQESLTADLKLFVEQATRVTIGRCKLAEENSLSTNYMPVGYVLSTMKDNESDTVKRREAAMSARAHRKSKDAQDRLSNSVS